MNLPALEDMRHEHLLPVARGLLREPLARRHIQKLDATEDNRIFTPDDVLGERLLRLASLLVCEAEQPGWIEMNTPDERRVPALLSFVFHGLKAAPYLWSEVVRAQLKTLAVPRHVLSPRLLPQPKLWFTFETGIGDSNITIDFFIVYDYGPGFQLVVFGDHQDGDDRRPFVLGQDYEYGRVFPDDYPDHPDGLHKVGDGGHLRALLTQLAFLASPYIPRQQLRASRAARRESARGGSLAAEQEVTFVVLRRPEGKRAAAEEGASVEWKHSWVVSGHLRAQWYPSEQAHRLIWIAPYLKGPEDAPLLEHAFKVAR